MTFEQLVLSVKNIPCDEIRTETGDFLEAVVDLAGIPVLESVLNGFFEKPFKAEGQKPSRESDKYANPYGGARQNQVLYMKENEAIAILWPWGSGTRVTVKLIKK